MERIFVDLLRLFFTIDQINTFFGDPRTAAIIVGGLVATAGAVLGVWLVLRRMAMTTDAISHTVLLGIVVAFIFVVQDLNSPLLIVGAALAGVATVVLTELIYRSGLVKADAALGLAFPLLFAVAILLISLFVEDAHLDSDAVMVGEIGLAWANTESYCYDNCEDVVITPDDPRAEVGRQCVNCSRDGIGPRSPEAVFEDICANCGTYTAAQAWRDRLIDSPPSLVFFPRAISVMTLIVLVNILFVTVFYKELKLATFDAALAKALGFRPGLLHYALMVLVSVTAVGAFDAVGSILVVAFFVIPPATLYLLTDRLSVMLVASPVVGALGALFGYDLARGVLFGLDLNGLLGLEGSGVINTSISAAMVMMMFVFFTLAWVFSPRYGLLSTLISRARQRRTFAEMMLMGHIFSHQGTARAAEELAVHSLHEHLGWPREKVRSYLTRLRGRGWVQVHEDLVTLTARGEERMHAFRDQKLVGHLSPILEASSVGVGD